MEVHKDSHKISYQINQINTSFFDSLDDSLTGLNIKTFLGKENLSINNDENCLIFWPEDESLVPSKYKEVFYTNEDVNYSAETLVSKRISFFVRVQLIDADIDLMQSVKDVLINSILIQLGMDASEITVSYQSDDNTDSQAFTFCIINFQMELPIYSRITKLVDANFALGNLNLSDAPERTENIYNPLLIAPPNFDL